MLNLIDSITYSTSLYTTRSLFEQHKLIFTSQMVFQILLTNKEIDLKELEFLLRYPFVPNLTSPVDFLNDQSWGGIKALSSMEEFHNLDRDIEGRTRLCEEYSTNILLNEFRFGETMEEIRRIRSTGKGEISSRMEE